MTVELQIDLAIRLLVGAVLGAAIGVEREIHEHPAGMRTHMLVALGCTFFTVLSIYGFDIRVGTQPVSVDPSRVAAQIVTGMGFIGAGAILKYGTSIRGLTTAASLWSTAAIGVGVGTGQYVLALVATALVLVSLWPLHRVADMLRARSDRTLRVRLWVESLDTLGEVSAALDALHVAIAGVHTQLLGPGRYELELDLRLPHGVGPAPVVTAIGAVKSAELVETDRRAE